MAAAMFADWSEYFFMIGSSAAALIGLMFIVVTLTAGRDRQQLETGKHLYTSPIVWHLAVVMVLSAAALAPAIHPTLFGIVTAGLALLGIAMGIRSAVGIGRAQLVGPQDNLFDMWWYGIVPAIVYVALGAAAAAVLAGASWSASAIAAALMALLLVSIHAEWDLVTFLAPRAGEPSKRRSPPGEKP